MSVETDCLEGHWFDGISSARVAAQLTFDDDGQVSVCATEDQRPLARQDFVGLQVSPRLGNTPRYLEFADGGKFECRNNSAIDAWQRRWQTDGGSGLLHRLESHWHLVLVSVLVVVACGYGTVRYGVPAAASVIARYLPWQISEMAGQHTLATLDQVAFKSSTLSSERQRQVREDFQQLLQHYPEVPWNIQFRAGGPLGANAFALPDGTLIFTDEMLALARHKDELRAVLAHEVGHVMERHSLQSMVRNSLFGFLLLAVSGDVSASSELLFAVPLVLMELGYSREFERQADDFSLQYLRREGIDPAHFSRLMNRLEHADACLGRGGRSTGQQDEDGSPQSSSEASADTQPLSALQCLQQLSDQPTPAAPQTDTDQEQWRSYLSSHPSTHERLEKFR